MREMTKAERELIDIIRKSDNPEQALQITMEILENLARGCEDED